MLASWITFPPYRNVRERPEARIVRCHCGTLAQASVNVRDMPEVRHPGVIGPGITTLGVNPWADDCSKLVTLEQFVADKAKLGYDVPLPDSPLANRDNIGSIWENTFTGGAAIYFPSSGIELVYGGIGIDFTGALESEIQTIGGVRAIAVRAGRHRKEAEVMLPIPAGHLVTIIGDRPLSDLVGVAETMVSGSE